jgi:serine/threonine protein kinase
MLPREKGLGSKCAVPWIVLQITEAFEVMNERSAIHRNLKSANIKATPNGKVKILNF